jgi:hypothetical protein
MFFKKRYEDRTSEVVKQIHEDNKNAVTASVIGFSQAIYHGDFLWGLVFVGLILFNIGRLKL